MPALSSVPIGAASGSFAMNDSRKTREIFPLTGLDFVEWHPSEGWEYAVEMLDVKTLSIHLPKIKGDPKKQAEVIGYLDYLAKVDSANVLGAVLHPDQDYDWSIFGDGANICIENLDATRPGFQTPEDLQKFFQRLPKARLCFDIGHAFAVDPSGKVAHALVDALGDRISHLHISHVEPNGAHHVLQTEDCRKFWPVLNKLRPLPFVLEPDVNMPPSVLHAQRDMLAAWLPARMAPELPAVPSILNLTKMGSTPCQQVHAGLSR